MSEILPRSDDLDATWSFIEPGIRQILGADDSSSFSTKRVSKILSPTMYMEVYTAIYNYCVNKSRSSGQLHHNSNNHTHGMDSSTIKQSTNQSSILVGSEIYCKLNEYLKSYITSFKKNKDESFLQFYVRRWKRFTIGAIFLNHAFDYMNRYWVQKERSDGKRDIFDVNTLCLMTWKKVLFDQNYELLVKEILEQITIERDGGIIKKNNITTAIKSFVALGIDPQDLKKLNLNVYIQNFEKSFLSNTRDYYTQYSNDYLSNHSVTEYIFQAHEIILKEEGAMSMYWDDHTRKPLSETLNSVLIVDHAPSLQDEFLVLLDSRDQAKITALYNLMQRDFVLLPELASKFETYVKKAGENEISELLSIHKAELLKTMNDHSNPNIKKQQQNNNNHSINQSLAPKDYIKKLIKVHDTFFNITNNCFLNDPLFTKALDNACRAFVNSNEFALPQGSPRSATSKTPEMLAKYCDQLLKKSTKPEILEDMSVDDVMMIFKFLTDKDAFESHYRRLFAKRLIHGTSTSDTNEEMIIQRLQNENSMEYTGKITKMFQDVRISKILEEDFDKAVKGLPDYTRNKFPSTQPFILAETMWPFSYQKVDFILPKEIQPSHKKLAEMYQDKHSGRILKWLWPLCRAELKADIGKPGRPPFHFTVTLFQMSILLLFNDNDRVTLSQIHEGTGLTVQNIAAALVPFIKFKLIIQNPPGLENIIKPETQFAIARPYKALKTKINFAGGIKNDVLSILDRKNAQNLNNSNNNNNNDNNNTGNNMNSTDDKDLTENEKIEKELATERQMFLEACIVRIMKAKRQLPHTTLVNECMAQAHQRFVAKISMIKRAIDSLIQKEYLERCNDGESYRYLA
ncbi:hypothetical protein TBLA_0A05930 [Henningerozyma blattae CBS 6284]|uniref:Cullin family profile domain-containing protein n=1 Tax=Henningerozyma blattae (strain ATCC 34711 / CBS 6284 / DSM 70876 / NBRC 10599 / NRRL Y-10934 / UCD 77-7) TaxID=1071380 RepID=I2GW84_HENB6|nr:hypothetical protein TBLA_0A05930 [Tetrapisispora blattae CBS 6284]CCH58386.1 hypothetical protein TBLA_0A05930 [Tetrapisispora blattae CBS 6284]